MQNSRLLQAFQSPNYRLFFTGQGISLVGTWMTQVATIWVVYHLTNSALWLGVVTFASQAPTFFLTSFAGVAVDRWPRRRVLLWTQALAMLQSLALAGLAFTGLINIWQVIGLSVFQGLINAVDAPARQTFVKEIVDNPKALGNAIALNSSMFSAARLIGPAIGGLLIATVGTATCFLIDGLSYIAVIATLLMMKLRAQALPSQERPQKAWQQFVEGLQYAFDFVPIRSVLLLLATISFVGTCFITLGPIFATEVLHGGAEVLGFLMAASGCGALAAGLYLGSRATVVGLGKVIAIAPTLLGLGLIGFSLSQSLWLSLPMMLLIGGGTTLQAAATNTFLQTIIEDDKRGRVMSLFIMAFMGMAPFGNLFAGFLANYIGAPHTVLINGCICILCSVLFAQHLPKLRPFVRPIYAKIGVLPH